MNIQLLLYFIRLYDSWFLNRLPSFRSSTRLEITVPNNYTGIKVIKKQSNWLSEERTFKSSIYSSLFSSVNMQKPFVHLLIFFPTTCYHLQFKFPQYFNFQVWSMEKIEIKRVHLKKEMHTILNQETFPIWYW